MLRKTSSSDKSSIAAFVSILLAILCCMQGCKPPSKTKTAFYYWKGSYEQRPEQVDFLKQANSKHLYLRFMDIKWNEHTKQLFPEAVIRFRDSLTHTAVTPVVFITNQSFEKMNMQQADSLALLLNKFLLHIAAEQKLDFSAIQIDCDWTLGTREKYFGFLTALKKSSGKKLEATIRLHQIKYHFRTGIPPVDRGILMFYNMGKLSADPSARNSIYNPEDAAPYIHYISNYKLPLDVALPLFSWSLHIRKGKIIQVYAKIGRTQLSNTADFEPDTHQNTYRAKRNFFIAGVYVKSNDLFKLEESNPESLTTAADQLSPYLNKKEKRNIIYYELANLDPSTFTAKDIQKISAHF